MVAAQLEPVAAVLLQEAAQALEAELADAKSGEGLVERPKRRHRLVAHGALLRIELKTWVSEEATITDVRCDGPAVKADDAGRYAHGTPPFLRRKVHEDLPSEDCSRGRVPVALIEKTHSQPPGRRLSPRRPTLILAFMVWRSRAAAVGRTSPRRRWR
jgi:hypothetical protein